MSIEAKLANGMGYEYCVPFSRARVAIAYLTWLELPGPLFIPSNVCPALAQAIGNGVRYLPVDNETGLSTPTDYLNVQLYGCRQQAYCHLEIDPLMTGWGQESKAKGSVISFGYSKTIDLGRGAAFLTSSGLTYQSMKRYSDAFLPDELSEELDGLPDNIARRKERAALWDKHLGDCCIKPPLEQVIPWRVIRRIPNCRDKVVKALRDAFIDAGTNYPPLPGMTDPSAVQWGKEVINLWVTDTTNDYDEPQIIKACDIIKRTIDENR